MPFPAFTTTFPLIYDVGCNLAGVFKQKGERVRCWKRKWVWIAGIFLFPAIPGRRDNASLALVGVSTLQLVHLFLIHSRRCLWTTHNAQGKVRVQARVKVSVQIQETKARQLEAEIGANEPNAIWRRSVGVGRDGARLGVSEGVSGPCGCWTWNGLFYER